MKIVEANAQLSRITTLNDIPAGQVFRGEIRAKSTNTYTSGIFYKAYGAATISRLNLSNVQVPTDVIVVRLDLHDLSINGKKFANLFIACAEVQNYEPLDVELVIKGRK